MRPEYFDGMQMNEDFAVMAALQWDNLWSSACRGWKSITDAEIQHHELSMDATHTHLTAARRAKLLCLTTTLFLKGHGF